jgi:hypothetical protein
VSTFDPCDVPPVLGKLQLVSQFLLGVIPVLLDWSREDSDRFSLIMIFSCFLNASKHSCTVICSLKQQQQLARVTLYLGSIIESSNRSVKVSSLSSRLNSRS